MYSNAYGTYGKGTSFNLKIAAAVTRQDLIDRSEARIRQILKEDDYFLLLDAIEDRNRLSHIYDDRAGI